MMYQVKTNIYWFPTLKEAEEFRQKRDKKRKYSTVRPAGEYRGAGYIVRIAEEERVIE